MDVSIIIVNYNTKELTKNCLKSVYEQTKDLNFEIFLVDNASSDGSQEMIKNEFPNVILIENKENLGFGRANNLGMEIAKGKYIFLLNSDTILLNNAVKIFFNWYEENNIKNNIGAIGSYLLNNNMEIIHSFWEFNFIIGQLKHRYNIVLRIFIIKILKKIKLIKPFKKNSNKKENKLINIEVDYITGADLFIKSDVIKKIGKFNEKFFMYFEETDLQYRMELEGLKRIIINGPKIIHLEGMSEKVSSKKREMITKSLYVFLNIYRSRTQMIIFKTLYLMSIFIEIVIDFFEKKYTYKENINYLKFVWKLSVLR